ncbi:carbonic anhydrase 2-like isoform X2 [Hyposmocoma kahamanoa]|uniref:carbonic anhydrase 2-like isoform X2 n=1 Tax=Hyposmocoma kahamanoa TaxID=1477025 RepID=UPI000E6DA11D|nr:carbonic anhydrase 2-like isoform X2 [Hyposmocoma kahamanoa]XP_026322273.1 carbonic anhydrase 2-like isoform X2 [Hyposmocoma kahamanoa]XP_026322274.1 carbonic anhydrase 2-like isoform X2 [Hyposmocoma kahamanoa]XP_026322275.1 carbonic anhydrase 2-like isoform X2 [Hyposmocoma kahamanoa]
MDTSRPQYLCLSPAQKNTPVHLSNALIGAKWRTERPYIEGGPFLEKHVFSQIHFHWGANLMEGSDHIVDNRKHPGEMHVTFFRSEYLTQEEAFQHPDGVAIFCYLITHGLEPDPRLEWVIEGFKRVQESKNYTRIGPRPMSKLIPMFFEDYFLYWGTLHTTKGKDFVCRWIIPRCVLSADEDQMKQFHKLWDPYDEPIVRNFRPLQAKEERTVFFISPHWSQYNSLLPLPKSLPETSISILSQEYATKPWMLPPQNAYMMSEQTKKDDDAKAQRTSDEKQMITDSSDK